MAQAHRIKPPLKLDIFRYVRWMVRETLFLLTLVVAGYLLFALLDFDPRDAGWTHTGPEHVYNRAGAWGAWLADVGFYFFGYLAYLFPLALGLLGWRLFHVGALAELDGEVVFFRVLGFLVALGAGCGLATLHLQGVPGSGSGGGIVGTLTGHGLLGTFDALGVYSYLAANLFMLMLFVAAITLALGRALMDLLELLGQVASAPIALVFWLMAQLQGKASPPVTADAQAAPAAPAEPATAPATPLAASPLVAAAAPKDDGGIRVEPVINPFLEQPSPAAKADAGPVATPEAPPPASSAPAPTLPASSAPAPTPPRLEKEPVPATVSESPSLPAAMASWIGTLTGKRHETEPPAPAVLKTATTATAAPQPAPATGPIPPPPLDLLTVAPTEPGGYSTDVLETMSRQVETLLQHYGIGAEVVAVEPGPVITCFELAPALGVKVNQISNLAKDLARGLSVPSVRVVEVIPGKSVVGLEIPNQRRKTVYLSEILDSAAYRESESALTLVLGKDIGGRPIVANLARMPHLLVAGTTGSGKSVAINAMLLSMLYKADPSQVRLILVDPKMLELSIYEDIPHLLAPVVTDMKQAANALRWCVGEMDRRYRLMATLKVRNIAGFNQKVVDAAESGSPLADPLYRLEQPWEEGPVPALEPLPFIVVIVDELADMMMTVGKQVEELIARLAQKARAAGIHLILATQRPSVDVITGLIKANIPTRIAFQVSSKVDSRTILDQMGAEQLLGCGDMLYLPPGTGFPLRVHGAFVDDAEVLRVVEHLRRQGRANYRPEVLEENIGAAAGVAGAAGGGEADPLYDEAVRIVTETQRASVSGVQRRLKIGYNRAARMIEEMEAAGIVGPLQGNGSREVLAAAPPENN